jgi:hypothetical protein
MQSITKLATEMPWLMAPASVIAGMVVILVITLVIRIGKDESRMMVAWVIMVLAIWVVMLQLIIK